MSVHSEPQHTPTRAELGRSEWMLLHAQADQVADFMSLWDLVSQVRIVRNRFPCSKCRHDVVSFSHALASAKA